MLATDGSRHAPAFEFTDEVARAMQIASELCLVEDPPEEPFRSKYKAREILLKAKQGLRDTGGEVTAVTSVLAVGAKVFWWRFGLPVLRLGTRSPYGFS